MVVVVVIVVVATLGEYSGKTSIFEQVVSLDRSLGVVWSRKEGIGCASASLLRLFQSRPLFDFSPFV